MLRFFIACAIFYLAAPVASCQSRQDSSAPVNSFSCTLQKSFPSLRYVYDDAQLIHDYSGNWDFDGDGDTDSLQFVGDGGAHLYYRFRLKLSHRPRAEDFSFIMLDLPVFDTTDVRLNGAGKIPAFPQFVVRDFDGDGRPDIYCNIRLEGTILPLYWRKRGVRSDDLWLHWNERRIELSNFRRK